MKHFAKLLSAELEGIEAHCIEVETDIHVGLHTFSIVGLADKALSESKERINAALKNIGIKPPSQENKKITINLAPADLKKTGSQYDVPIALGYLIASEQLKPAIDVSKIIFVGELSLDGLVRPINGALNIARLAHRLGLGSIFVPAQNAPEAAIVEGVTVYPVRSLRELMSHIEGRALINPQPQTNLESIEEFPFTDIAEVKGQEHAKRALIIAAAGGHNLLMVGPPGTGKTMLAQSLASILPRPTREEMIEITQIYSAAGLLKDKACITYRPFRSPHQTASSVAIIGGGQSPRPGEVSLAHRGVLFLDELPEFRRDLLESLRQPIESGRAIITRIRSNLTFPARFILATAMNPCPCGYYGDEEKACICSAHEIGRYQKKVSGPLLDRIDLQLVVPRLTFAQLEQKAEQKNKTGLIKDLVSRARERQAERFSSLKRKIFTNAELSSKEADELINIHDDAREFLRSIFDKELVSARGYYRILKTAQTIADLDEVPRVEKNHIAEAFQYRLRER